MAVELLIYVLGLNVVCQYDSVTHINMIQDRLNEGYNKRHGRIPYQW